MKHQKNKVKKGIFKKVFIKFCRFIGFEIIDQSNFHVPTQDKLLNQNLNIQGEKSITIPLGETKIVRKVESLTVIFRSCTNVNMLTQNKKRLFDKKKSEYTFRSLNSIINSINYAKNSLDKVKFDIIVIDHNSPENDINQIKRQLIKSNIKHSLIFLNIDNFKPNINKINEENKNVSENQISNMSNIHKSLLIAQQQCKDLIYFVEDDYLHREETFEEIIFSYEKLSTQLNKELFFCPADYPYLYTKLDSTHIFLGSKKHWRIVNETLCTFLTSKKILNKHMNKLVSMCLYEHFPFEKPLHQIYREEYCLSPIPSLALHCTNINSAYGLSPAVDWINLWNENENY